MISKYKFIFFCLMGILEINAQKNYTKQVNPFIGTGGAGHTFPGAVLPFGMVQLSPDTRIDGSWEGCSGYHYSDSVIYGFSHTHLSGTGVSDYGDILIMPTIGKTSLDQKTYCSQFSHLTEKASPGFYAVTLKNNQVQAELTATTRVGIHRYTFPKTKDATIILDLLHRDKTLQCDFKIIDSVTVSGYRVSEGWAKEQHVYFVIKFNKAFKNKDSLIRYKEQFKSAHKKTAHKLPGAFFQFDLSDGKPLVIKVAISQTSEDGARLNLEAEAKHWDFDLYKQEAEKAWQKQLSKIEVSSPDEEKLTVFYTALYHCMIHPSTASDVDGKYRGRDQKIHQANGFVPYTVFSLWDTFRALHPLFTIIEQKRTNDFIHTFLNQYAEAKRMPMWELSANETNCMIGFHSVSVIADAFAKNIRGYDSLMAYQAMVSASNYTSLGAPIFNKNDYLQVDDEPESVSKTLEYGYDNWCVAQMALQLNNRPDFLLFSKRAQAYRNLFDSQTGLIRPRKNGNWLSPFDPREVSNYYTEANGWQYSFFVPQDIRGLMKLMGGESGMEKKLDDLFGTSPQTTGRKQPDITGLIGQYAHGNEPSHHMAYLYNYVGKPEKTQEKVYQILTQFYKNKPDGLIGNEDCGQMSAWYVLSAMGFYQVCPGLPQYAIGTPLFDDVKINLENGKTFQLKKENPSQNFQYIKSYTLKGRERLSSVLEHQTIMEGGIMTFTMQPPSDTLGAYGKANTNRPHSQINIIPLIVSPTIASAQTEAGDKTLISIQNTNKSSKIYYTLNGQEPSQASTLYTTPFMSDSTTTVKVKAYRGKDSSSVTVSRIYRKPNSWQIKLNSTYDESYSAGGNSALIDGMHGTINWQSGEWQGYQGQNFECVIDLGKTIPVEYITSTYLQDTKSWIIFPKTISYETSDDGVTYKPFRTIENGIEPQDYSVQIRTFSGSNPLKTKARYVKIKAINFGKLPEWHQGKGSEAFIFIDEIEVR